MEISLTQGQVAKAYQKGKILKIGGGKLLRIMTWCHKIIPMEPKTCHHCGNEWTPRKANPKKCPRCMNPLWKSPRPKKQRPVVEMVYQDRSDWPEGVKVMMAEAIKNATPSVEESFTAVETQTECLRAPESDTLSEQKRRVEELMRSLA